MKSFFFRVSFVALLAFAPACASTSAAPAFRETSRLVEARTGRRIFWNQGGAADAAVARRVRELLARDLSVDAAVQIGLLDNRELQALYEDLSVAQADLVQAGLLQNPTLSGGSSVPVAGAGVGTGFDLGVTQDFVALFFLSARQKIARAELEATELRVADAVFRTTFEVQAAYYTLLAAQQTLELRRQVVETGDAAVALAQAQHEAGNINDLDLVVQTTLYEQLRTDVVRGEADVISAREALTRLLGLWGDGAAFRVPAKLPDAVPADGAIPPSEELEALALARRLDLGALHQETEARAHAAGLARSARFFGGAAVGATFERSPERYSAITPQASVQLPIFDQGQAVVARAEAEERRASARERALAVDVRSEVRVARARLAATRALLERYATVVVPLRERAMRLSQEQYNAMLLGTYPLLAAKQSEVDAYLRLIEALRDYWIARADLERALGSTLPTRASGPPPPAPNPGATPSDTSTPSGMQP